MNHERLASRINLLGPWLKKRFCGPVVKIGLNAGLGCPNRDGTVGRGGCSFCPPGGSGQAADGLSISEQLEQGLDRLSQKARRANRRQPAALAYFQAYSSTHAQPERLKALYDQALDVPGVAGLIVSTRPDCLDQPRWEVLSDLNRRTAFWLELGLQSAHDETLKAIGRGHDAASFGQAVKEAHNRGIKVTAHVILGLPGEDRTHTRQTAEYLAQTGIWGVKMHNLMVLDQTRLAGEMRSGSFVPWGRELWAQTAADFLAHLPRRVLIHRLAADPGADELLGPDWASDKDGALTALAQSLEQTGLEQGALCQTKS